MPQCRRGFFLLDPRAFLNRITPRRFGAAVVDRISNDDLRGVMLGSGEKEEVLAVPATRAPLRLLQRENASDIVVLAASLQHVVRGS